MEYEQHRQGKRMWQDRCHAFRVLQIPIAHMTGSDGDLEMEQVAEAGCTAHDVLALRQHTTYMELEVEAGIVSKEAKDSFLEGIKGTVEANSGEANRVRREAEELAGAVGGGADVPPPRLFPLFFIIFCD